MNTKEIMQIALDLVGFKEIPEDSEIYVEGDNIKSVLIGIDIGVVELLLARQMGVDAVIVHHPAGDSAILNFHKVLWKHKDLLIKYGVPEDVAHKTVEPLVYNYMVENHRENYDHTTSVARLLDIPFMNIHNPCDEMGRRLMEKKLEESLDKNAALQDVKDCLNELEEFKTALTDIEIRIGNPDNKAGKIAVVHGAGTNGGCDIAKTYFDYGINTVIYIHIKASELEKLKAKPSGNLIITGHIASDALGINPFIHKLEESGINVFRVSGL